jgi:hypothetical protein
MKRQALLTGIAVFAASLTILPLLAHAAGWLPMYFLMDLTAGPAAVLLLAVGAIAHRIVETVFLHRLWIGTVIGFVATLAYDVVRALLVASGFFRYNPFISHPIFGHLITRAPLDSAVAYRVGWAYHFWNGASFGMIYALLAGRAHWGYAVAWAMFLEFMWLSTLPSVMNRAPNVELVTMSLIGHLAYGVALGFLARRYVRM